MEIEGYGFGKQGSISFGLDIHMPVIIVKRKPIGVLKIV
jgi:hypothetical protein